MDAAPSPVQAAIPLDTPSGYSEEPAAVPDDSAPEGRDLELSRDPEELGKEASIAVSAGMRKLSAMLSDNGAVPGQDPERQAKIEAFARGEGRMTDEEVAAIDKIIDPDNQLTPSQKSTARIAAIYRHYDDKGDTDTASNMAARAILYSKFASQSRGAMAAHALQNGDIKNGVKLLQDAYDDIPNGERVQSTINDDGTVDFETGYDRAGGFIPVQKGRATTEQMIQLASNTAMGKTQMDAFTRMATMGDAQRKSGSRGGGSRATAARGVEMTGDEKGFSDARKEYEAAVDTLRRLPDDATPEQREAAYVRAREAYNEAHSAIPVKKGKSREYALKEQGIVPPQVSSPVTSGGKGTTKEEREAARADAEVKGLTRERALVEAGDIASRAIGPTGESTRQPGMSEGAASEIARRQFGTAVPDYYNVDAGRGDAAEAARTRVNSRRAAIGYGSAADAPGASDPLVERAKPYLDALEGTENESGVKSAGLLGEARKDKNGNVDPKSVRKLTQEERDKFTDIFGRLGKKNDTMSPRTLAQTVYDIANPQADEIMGRGPRPEVDFKTGKVSYNGRTFFADDQTITELAAMRGKRAQQFLKADLKANVARRDRNDNAARLEKDAEDKARRAEASKLPATIRQIEQSLAGYEEGLPKIKDEGARQEYMNTIEALRARRDAFRKRYNEIQTR